VYVCSKVVHRAQPTIHLWHMDEKFGGIAVQKRKWLHTQHGVPTDHFAKIGGPSGVECSPYKRYEEGHCLSFIH
jgi:hypothetical protein